MSIWDRSRKEPRKSMAETELGKISDLVAEGSHEQKAALGRRIVMIMPVMFAQAQLGIDQWEEKLFMQVKDSLTKLFFRLRNPQTTFEELGQALMGPEGKVLQDICVEAMRVYQEEQKAAGRPVIAPAGGAGEPKSLGPVR